MIKKILPLLVLVVLLMPMVAFGLEAPDTPLGKIPEGGVIVGSGNSQGQYSATTIRDMVVTIINWFTWLVALAAVVMGLYSGFLFITARDNATQLATARNIMLYSIIGIGVAILAFSIVSISKSIFGLTV